MARYIPRQGDFIILSFDPQSGHEQRGRRPALVVSKFEFNRRAGLVIACPVTNTTRDSPFHVAVPSNSSLTGHIMVEQVKSVDFRSRRAAFVERAPDEVLDEVLAILDALLYP